MEVMDIIIMEGMEVMGIIIMEVMDIIIMEGMATTIMATIITMGIRVTMAMVEVMVMVMVMEGIITRATRVCLCRGILARFNAISVGRWATTPMLVQGTRTVMGIQESASQTPSKRVMSTMLMLRRSIMNLMQ